LALPKYDSMLRSPETESVLLQPTNERTDSPDFDGSQNFSGKDCENADVIILEKLEGRISKLTSKNENTLRQSYFEYGDFTPIDCQEDDHAIPEDHSKSFVFAQHAREQSAQELKEIFNATIEKVIKFENDPKDDYKPINSSKDIQCWRKEVPGSMACLVCAKIKLMGMTPDQCYKMLYDLEIRQSWDGIFSEIQLVENLSAHQDIIYMKIKVNFFIGVKNKF
jgi:hypothetical protein